MQITLQRDRAPTSVLHVLQGQLMLFEPCRQGVESRTSRGRKGNALLYMCYSQRRLRWWLYKLEPQHYPVLGLGSDVTADCMLVSSCVDFGMQPEPSIMLPRSCCCSPTIHSRRRRSKWNPAHRQKPFFCSLCQSHRFTHAL